MPRSGTTLLTDILYKSDKYFCFTYSDFPFFELPNLWSYFKSIYFAFNKKNKKRLHDDGVYIDYKSIDSFDEIVLNRIINKNIKNQINFDQYIEYLSVINHCTLSRNKKKYLAKNFHMIFKLDKILDLNHNSKFIITFRNPINQVYSLMRQHLNFSKLKRHEYKLNKKMKIMNHFEFGPSRVFFSFYDKKFNLEHEIEADIYLSYWLYLYNYLYDNYKNNKRVIFVNYDDLINKSNDKILNNVLKKISNFLNININVSKNSFFVKNNYYVEADQHLLMNSKILYEKLSKL